MELLDVGVIKMFCPVLRVDGWLGSAAPAEVNTFLNGRRNRNRVRDLRLPPSPTRHPKLKFRHASRPRHRLGQFTPRAELSLDLQAAKSHQDELLRGRLRRLEKARIDPAIH
jgi:hypothetical protein